MDLDRKKTSRIQMIISYSPFFILGLLFVLLPTFFFPFQNIPIQVAKSFLVLTFVFLASVGFIVNVFIKKNIGFPMSPILIAGKLLVLVYLAAALFSPVFSRSFFGYGFENSTLVAMLLGVTIMGLVAVVFRDRRKIFVANAAFLVVSALLGLFGLIRLVFGADIFSFNIFLNVIDNPVGKWIELAIFFGTSAIVSLAALEILKLDRIYRVILNLILILSVLVVILVSLPVISYVFTVFVLGLALYSLFLSFKTTERELFVKSDLAEAGQVPAEGKSRIGNRKIAWRPLAIVFVMVIFMFPFTQRINDFIWDITGVNNFEVRPSWPATLEVLGQTWKSSPILGAGPNRFANVWEINRPDVNISNFWSMQFESGVGFMPTAFVETGILGALSWFLFILALMYAGFKGLFMTRSDLFDRFLMLSSFGASSFLWACHVFYTPSLPIFMIAFFFTGLFVASTIQAGLVPTKVFNLSKIKKYNFLPAGVLIILIALLVGGYYILLKKNISLSYFGQAQNVLMSGGNVDVAENLMVRAIQKSPNDIYYRALSDLNLRKVNSILETVIAKSKFDEEQNQSFQLYLARAIEASRLAIVADPTSYENYLVSSRVYQAIVPVGVEGTYDRAKSDLEAAISNSPKNPFLFLQMAELEIANKNTELATQHINQALELKPNYIEAIFLQTQIDVATGNIQSAIKGVQQIAQVSPNDPLVYFRLGLLKYELKDYAGAIAAFEKSISLVPVYANAKYFLGLSYENSGRRAEAIKLFEELGATNPDNAEIQKILNNLKAGRGPFTDEPAPSPDEELEDLPVSEDN